MLASVYRFILFILISLLSTQAFSCEELGGDGGGSEARLCIPKKSDYYYVDYPEPPEPLYRGISKEEPTEIPMEYVDLDYVPSVFLYMIDHLKKYPLTSKEWRMYKAEKQSFEDLPEKVKKKSTPWTSPRDNIYMAFVIKFNNKDLDKSSYLLTVSSISVAQVL